MSGRIDLELEASLDSTEPTLLAVTAPDDVSVGSVLDVVAEHLGLTSAAGAVQARSTICGTWVDRSARLPDAGLARGESLRLVVGLRPGSGPAPLSRWSEARRADLGGRVAISRPPRSVTPEPSLTLTAPVRRAARRPRRFPLGAMLIPLAIGLLLVVIVRRWEIALFSLFTPVMVAWNYVEERRTHREEVRENGLTYAQELDAVEHRTVAHTAAWVDWVRTHHPAPDEVSSTARTLGGRLWERVPGDPDHLRLRLGVATRHAPVGWGTGHLGQDDEEPRARVEASSAADDVPVVVDLMADGMLALVGPDGAVDDAAGWVAAQLATLHSPADLVMVAALSDDTAGAWWRWLPHLAGPTLTRLPLAGDRSGADELLRSVIAAARERRAVQDGRRTLPGPLLAVFVDDRLRPDPALVAAVVDARDVGVVVVWLGSDPRAVPTASPSTLRVLSPTAAELVTHRGGTRTPLRTDAFPARAAADLARWLAPLRDAADAHRARPIPERVSLEDLVTDVASPVAIRRRWDARGDGRLLARLGSTDTGPVELDLGPDGSHALVGGTTGSGKSELLQTLVTSIATHYPPSRVGFLLVDYKGGAAFKDAADLPHCVGVVTDLDEHLTRRVMRALDAEIRRREELLAAAGARDLAELRRRDEASTPADLLIVVDEFATLAKEIPEFVEGMVDVAARGRSLGLRLVLATQRPAGVINDRIRANVGVRIALRVNDEADSMDVIGDRVAAHVDRTLPGRAYLRVHRDLAEFQSAYVGGPVRSGATARIEVRPLDGAPRTPPAGPSGGTVLEAVVAACHQVMRLGRWPRPHVPWLPALPAVVTLGRLATDAPTLHAGQVLLALADLPHEQAQRLVVLDLQRHQSLLVFGTSRSGKTTVLRTVAAGLVDSLGPDELQLYGMDFAGHGLHLLEEAPQCLGVVGPNDPGRIARLVRRLVVVVEERTVLMASVGATDLPDLVRRTGASTPCVVVLLDGYAGAAAALERLDGGRLLDRFERLVAEGPAAGVHFLISADRRAAVPSSLTSVITTRLVLRMAERDDYALLGVEAALARRSTMEAGRGFIQGATEAQVAVLADGTADAERSALDDLVRRAADRWPRAGRALGRMPVSVALADLPVATSPFVLDVGVGDDDVAPAPVDLTDSHLLVTGPARSGRTTTLATIAAAAARSATPPAVVAFASRRSPLRRSDGWAVPVVDVDDAGDLARGIDDVEVLLAAGRSVLCCCDDVDLLTDAASAALEGLARRGRDEPVRLVASSENRAALRAYAGLVPELRRSKQAVLLTPDVEIDGDLVGVRLRAPTEPVTGIGRGFLVRDGQAQVVQIAQSGDADLPPTADNPTMRAARRVEKTDR